MCHFFFCQQLKSSAVSVVFVFKASLSDVAPASLILAAVDLMETEKVLIVYVAICVCCFFCVFTTKMKLCECCV